MQPLLDAIHALQTVPFTINLPVLHFLRRWNPPPMPVAPDKSKLTPGQYWYAKKKHSEALAERTAWDLIVATAEAMPERFLCRSTSTFAAAFIRSRISTLPAMIVCGGCFCSPTANRLARKAFYGSKLMLQPAQTASLGATNGATTKRAEFRRARCLDGRQQRTVAQDW